MIQVIYYTKCKQRKLLNSCKFCDSQVISGKQIQSYLWAELWKWFKWLKFWIKVTTEGQSSGSLIPINSARYCMAFENMPFKYAIWWMILSKAPYNTMSAYIFQDGWHHYSPSQQYNYETKPCYNRYTKEKSA